MEKYSKNTQAFENTVGWYSQRMSIIRTTGHSGWKPQLSRKGEPKLGDARVWIIDTTEQLSTQITLLECVNASGDYDSIPFWLRVLEEKNLKSRDSRVYNVVCDHKLIPTDGFQQGDILRDYKRFYKVLKCEFDNKGRIPLYRAMIWSNKSGIFNDIKIPKCLYQHKYIKKYGGSAINSKYIPQ